MYLFIFKWLLLFASEILQISINEGLKLCPEKQPKNVLSLQQVYDIDVVQCVACLNFTNKTSRDNQQRHETHSRFIILQLDYLALTVHIIKHKCCNAPAFLGIKIVFFIRARALSSPSLT